MEPSSIRTHGEMAIAKAQMGQRQTDIGYKIGVSLWFVLAVAFGLFSVRAGSEGVSSIVFWGLQFCAFLISAGVAVLIQRISANRHNKEQTAIRRENADYKQRQLDEFMRNNTQ